MPNDSNDVARLAALLRQWCALEPELYDGDERLAHALAGWLAARGVTLPEAPSTAALRALLTRIRQELDDRYDGAPDSRSLWMGPLLRDIDAALKEAP